ncbi:MAG: hypothetical protein M3503_07590 [Actinomycetota bacterium]|nr:hypothetical protein [Actinomycetota bacterium]
MTRGPKAAAFAAIVAVVVGLLGSPASAAKPSYAGPPETETQELGLDPGEPFFVCREETLTFSGGTVTFRFKQLPGGRGFGIITFKGAEATSSTGEVFAVNGAGKFTFRNEESGSFRLNLVFVDGRRTERVNTRITFEGGAASADEKGTCTTVFPEGL